MHPAPEVSVIVPLFNHERISALARIRHDRVIIEGKEPLNVWCRSERASLREHCTVREDEDACPEQ